MPNMHGLDLLIPLHHPNIITHTPLSIPCPIQATYSIPLICGFALFQFLVVQEDEYSVLTLSAGPTLT